MHKHPAWTAVNNTDRICSRLHQR